MDVVQELDVEAEFPAETIEHRDDGAGVAVRIVVCALRGALRGEFPGGLPSVAAPLDADVAQALRHEAADFLGQLVERRSVGMSVCRGGLAALSAEELVHRHPGHLALDVPEGHVDARNRVVLRRSIAPVGVVVHRLPDILDAGDVPAREERVQVVVDEAGDRLVPVGQRSAAQPVQAGLRGFHLYDDEIDSGGRRAYRPHLANRNDGPGGHSPLSKFFASISLK